MKKVFLISIIILTIVLSGCSTAKKLSDLGYPEIDIENIYYRIRRNKQLIYQKIFNL